MERALEGILVVENTANESGPMCGQTLAMLGATVIKIERPLPGGDRNNKVVQERRLGFIMRNGNKKCITLNLKSEKGAQLAWKLIERADVFIENMSPGATDRLGFSYEAVSKRNPKIIYGRLKGFAQGSPWESCPSFDSVACAMGGGMYMTGEEGGEPLLFGPNVVDSGSGFFLAMGILAALIQRSKTGKGQLVDSPMQNTMIAFCRNGFEMQQTPGIMNFERVGNDYPGPRKTAPHQSYRTKGTDPKGDYFLLICGQDKYAEKLFEVIGRPEMIRDPKFSTAAARHANKEEMNQYISEFIAQRDKYELMELIARDNKIPSAACATTKELVEDEFLHALGIMQDVEDPALGRIRTPSLPFMLEDSPVEVKCPGYTGQDNDEIFLKMLGLSEEEYDRLYEEHVI